MSKDFVLRDKRVRVWMEVLNDRCKGERYSFEGYKTKDVKEFIKRLIADDHINSSGEASKRIRKLAGDLK